MPYVLLGNSFLGALPDAARQRRAAARTAPLAAERLSRQGQRSFANDRARNAGCDRAAGRHDDGPELHPRRTRLPRTRSAHWVAENLPKDISHKVHNALRLSARRHAALGARSWARRAGTATAGPSSSAARAGTRCRSHLFEEECALAGAPRIVPFGPVMVAPVIMAFGNARAAAALPARHRQRRGLVEPGLQRAGLGLRPGLAEVHAPSARATSTSSTARRPGPRSASTATGSSAWCAPAAKASRRPASASC